MSLMQIGPLLAYGAVVIFILMITFGHHLPTNLRWQVPGALGAIFLAFTLVTIAQDGLLQFWVNHTTNLSGNQVWFDLLLAVSIAFAALAPRARLVGMPLMPWALAVIATASIALLPMLARIIWLEQRNTCGA